MPKKTDKEIPVATVRITDLSFEAPDTLSAGYLHLEVLNESSEMHSAHLIKREKGYTTNQLIRSYSDSMRTGGARPPWMTHRGGLITEPGSSKITMFIEPGEYTWVCVLGDDTLPHFAGHEHNTVIVTGLADTTIKLSKPDLKINMTDKNHVLSEQVTSGNQSIELVNTGTKYHLAAISKLNDGANEQDVIKWFTDYKGPPPAQGIIATSAIGPGLNARIEINFEPGEYILFCMANAEGKFHLLDGAITSFTVE